ncbi:MAG: hypothetical protein LC794_06410 [Acidobacteria bacterium]|nr:hypothetical protein [Acidobacteriota bacterium]
MDHFREKKLREEYLLALLELHNGNYGSDVSNREACAKIGIEYNGEATRICQYLHRENFVTWVSFERIALTPAGTREAERIRDSRFKKKEARILDDLYNRYNSVPPDIKVVTTIEEFEHLKIPENELKLILSDLAERRLVDFQDDEADITHSGLRYVEARHRNQSPPTRGDSYTMHIGSVEGGVQQGPNSVQNINITNYQPISEILPHLIKLIEGVKAESFDEKDDVIRDLEKVRELALSNPQATPKDTVWTRVNAKLIAAKTSMDIAGVVVKTYPQWAKVLEFFRQSLP